VPINPVLVVETGIFEIIGQTRRNSEFITSVRIEISVTRATVDGPTVKTEIDETACVAGANRKVCRSIDHATVNPIVPLVFCLRKKLVFCLRKKIVEAGQSIVNTALRRETDGPQGAGNVGVNIRVRISADDQH
jgi:hypothetical protein